MSRRTEQLGLAVAFAAALGLHAAVLPMLNRAAGEVPAAEPAVDVVVRSLETPGYAKAGQRIGFEAFVAELRDQSFTDDTRFDRRDRVLLSLDRALDSSDNELISLDIPGVADAQETAERIAHELTLPPDADGPHFLIYQADADEQTPDIDRDNNTRTRPIFIDGPQQPELAVETFLAPGKALPGGTLVVDFVVQNVGRGWANTKTDDDPLAAPNWTDRVYLSQDERLDDSDILLRSFDRVAPLGPGAGYERLAVALPIPDQIVGSAYLILAADDSQQLDQPAFDQGYAIHPIELIDQRSPDLVVAELQDIQRLVIGRPSPVAFEIANLGNAPADDAWLDGLYLSPQPTLDSRAIPLALADQGRALPPRGRYATTIELTLPEDTAPGRWYLVAKADASQTIDEPGYEENNTAAVPITVLTQKQADAEIQLGSPQRPERFVVQWIEHDRVEEHRARFSRRTVQPAIQDRVDPVPDAPIVDNPLPPTIAQTPAQPGGNPSIDARDTDPTTQTDAPPAPAAATPTQTNQAPRPQDISTPIPSRIDGLPGEDGDLPSPRPGDENPPTPIPPTPIDPTPSTEKPTPNPSPNPGEREVDSPADPNAPNTDSTTDSQTPAETESPTDDQNPEESPAEQPAEQEKPTDADQPKPAEDQPKPTENPGQGETDPSESDQSTNPKPAEEDKTPQPDGPPDQPAETSDEQTPTRAPRDDSEALPTDNRKVEVALQDGRVLVGEGIEVTTKLPTRPGAGVRRLSLPRNARVAVTFDSKGKVYEAKVIRSTTYPEWDAAIEASLYRWSARGKAVEDANPYITIEWNYILNELLDGVGR